MTALSNILTTKQSTTVYLHDVHSLRVDEHQQHSEPFGLNKDFWSPPLQDRHTHPNIICTILKVRQRNMTSGRVDSGGEMTRDVR